MKETRTKTNKRNAFFVEIIIIILFFSLSVVISLELFVQGHLKSELSEQKNMALIRAQSAAERLEGWDPATVPLPIKRDAAYFTTANGIRRRIPPQYLN